MATLLVVMGLFFVVSMVAAYASRNLIFEQRTSANQYRATQAFEAAEAGLDWTLAMLNGGRIDAQCSSDPSCPSGSFRQRYLPDLVTTSGTPPLGAPGCQLAATGVWACGCPCSGAAAFVNPAGAATQPAYRVRFRELASPYPGFFTIESRGCTSADETCLTQAEVRGAGTGAAALVAIRAALVPALAARPQAALTVRQDVTGVTGKAVNTEAVASGVTIQHGTTTCCSLATATVAGGGVSGHGVVLDTALGAMSPELLFERFFGMSPQRFAAQASTVLACSSPSACSFSDVLTAAAANPGRPIWVPGDLTIDNVQVLGSTDVPVLLAVGGVITVNADAQINGVVFSMGNVSFSSGATDIRGALVTAASVVGSGAAYAVYDRAIIDRIRSTQGTIVRVPGSWRDY